MKCPDCGTKMRRKRDEWDKFYKCPKCGCIEYPKPWFRFRVPRFVRRWFGRG